MKRTYAAVFLTLAVLASGNAGAAQQTAKLSVANMYCASCPYIVKQALAAVPGVTGVKVSYDRASATAVATVDYEDTQADTAALTAATSDVGFPSSVLR
jgi:periplasmic mercuric ion binding protein